MSLIYGIVSLLLGGVSLTLTDPAGVPVLGLALAAAGLMRESRGEKRMGAMALCGVGAFIGLIGCILAIRARAH